MAHDSARSLVPWLNRKRHLSYDRHLTCGRHGRIRATRRKSTTATHRTQLVTTSAPLPAIEADNLKKTYRERRFFRRRSFEALRGVSFQVQEGEVFGLLGPNGAGKTTFIKVLLGIVRHTGGAARLMGQPAGSRTGRRRIGYLPENLRISNHHTAESALEFYGRLSGMGREDIRARRTKLLADVGLSERGKDRVRKYSKGMLQRLGLAQALMHDPDLLILDEPTDGLDPVGRSHVRNVLADLRDAGKTVFLNSHILQEVELVCDRVAILDHGCLLYVGPVSEVVGKTATDIELNLELIGDAAVIRLALGKDTILDWNEVDGVIRTKIHAKDQPNVDRVVDSIRKAGASISAMTPRRLSLEDAFLKLLAKNSSSR